MDDANKSVIEVSLLGGISVGAAKADLRRYGKSNATHLLGLLALQAVGYPKRPWTRDELCELLFSGLGGSNHRTNLRSALRDLRQLLKHVPTCPPDVFPKGMDPVELPRNVVRADVTEFENAMAQATKSNDDVERVGYLRRATRWYPGPLLPDHDQPHVVQQRLRLQDKYLNTLCVLTIYYIHARQLEDAEQYAREALTTDTNHVDARYLLAAILAQDAKTYSEAKMLLSSIEPSAPPMVKKLKQQLYAGGSVELPYEWKPGLKLPSFLGPEDEGRNVADAAFGDGAPTVFHMPHQPNRIFEGRGGIMDELDQQFDNSMSHGTLPAIVALRNMAGIGKTSTAIQYAYRWCETKLQPVLWVGGETLDTLQSDLLRLAHTLKVLPTDDHNPTAAVVRDAVAGWLQQRRGWLLVIDNVEQLDLALEWLPPGGQGCVLVTTRLKSLGGIPSISLPPLSIADGGTVLLRKMDIKASNEAGIRPSVEAIAERLGGLPLALDQVGAYLTEYPSFLPEFLDEYERSGDTLRREYPTFGLSQHESLYRTFAMARDKLVNADNHTVPDAPTRTKIKLATFALTAFCAFIAADHISERFILLVAPRIGTDLGTLAEKAVFHGVIAELCRFSLFEYHYGRRAISVHRVVQDVIRDLLGEAQADLVANCVSALAAVVPDYEHSHWDTWEDLLPHILRCLEHADRLGIQSTDAVSLCRKTGLYVRDRGRYIAALRLFEKVLASSEATWADQAEATIGIAGVRHGQYRTEEAIALLQDLADQDNELAPMLTADLRNNLGYYQTSAGLDFEAAQKNLGQALQIRLEQAGKNDRLTLWTQSNVALLLGKMGRMTESLALQREVREDRIRTLGGEHPDVGFSHYWAGQIYQLNGNNLEAAKCYVAALGIWDRTSSLGSGHVDVIDVKNRLLEVQRGEIQPG